ncbi:MAG: YdcF family protein [Oscillospiraceae bacterium]
MKDERKAKKRFIITETVLLFAAAFFEFALIGYKTTALVLAGIALLAALYRLIDVLRRKNEKTARALKRILSACLVLGVLALAAIEIPIIISARTDESTDAPYAIVMGAGVNGETPSLSLLNRLEAAKSFLDEHPESKAVVSGSLGEGEDISEAECMRRWLCEQGISPERIIMEEQAHSSSENIAYSLEKIAEDGGDPHGKVAIVSSEYHLYRSKYIAAKLGAKPVGVAGHTNLPILRVNYFLREAAAVLVMWMD